MANINIDNELWTSFLKQSIDLGKSASERIREFMKTELKYNKKR